MAGMNATRKGRPSFLTEPLSLLSASPLLFAYPSCVSLPAELLTSPSLLPCPCSSQWRRVKPHVEVALTLGGTYLCFYVTTAYLQASGLWWSVVVHDAHAGL